MLRSGKEVPHNPTLAGRAAHYSHPDRIVVPSVLKQWLDVRERTKIQ
jgi:hypothetical protein